MIYIDKNNNTQVVYIPRNGWTPPDGTEVTLEAISTSRSTVAVFAVANCEVRGLFLRMVIGLPENLTLGEWQYTLSWENGDERITSTGLLQVTEDSTKVKEYRKNVKVKQYGE